MDRRPKYTVRRAWMRLHPRRAWQMRFWLRVGKKVKAKGVRHRDLAKVRAIIKEVENGYR